MIGSAVSWQFGASSRGIHDSEGLSVPDPFFFCVPVAGDWGGGKVVWFFWVPLTDSQIASCSVNRWCQVCEKRAVRFPYFSSFLSLSLVDRASARVYGTNELRTKL